MNDQLNKAIENNKPRKAANISETNDGFFYIL